MGAGSRAPGMPKRQFSIAPLRLLLPFLVECSIGTLFPVSAPLLSLHALHMLVRVRVRVRVVRITGS